MKNDASCGEFVIMVNVVVDRVAKYVGVLLSMLLFVVFVTA